MPYFWYNKILDNGMKIVPMLPNSTAINVPEGANVRDASTFNLPVMYLLENNVLSEELSMPKMKKEILDNEVSTEITNEKRESHTAKSHVLHRSTVNLGAERTKPPFLKSLFQQSNNSTLPDAKDINYAANKTGLVLWFVSNCRTKRTKTRIQYAKELSKYIDINAYGSCSKAGANSDPCKRSEECVSKMMSQHKFYLSFENARCHW